MIFYQSKTQWEWESWLVNEKLLIVNYPRKSLYKWPQVFNFVKSEEKFYKEGPVSLTSLSEFDRNANATHKASLTELRKLISIIFDVKVVYKNWKDAWN